MAMVDPMIPPHTGLMPNAFVKMDPNTAGTSWIWKAMTTSDIKIYPKAMNGVTMDATRAIRLTPPNTTNPRIAASAMPEARGGTGKAFFTADDTPFDCTVVKKKPHASSVIAANTTPSHFFPNPCSIKLNGPPLNPEWCGNL